MILFLQKYRIVGILAAALALPLANAADFRSAKQNGSIFYAQPDLNAKKLFTVSQYYPVEQLAQEKDWIRVRDSSGGIYWAENQKFSTIHMVQVIIPQAIIYTEANPNSPIQMRVAQNVILEWLDTNQAGWIKVRLPNSKDNAGYIAIKDIWGG